MNCPLNLLSMKGLGTIVMCCSLGSLSQLALTIARDYIRLYSMERDRLKIFLEKPTRRISLTTNTWTSIQNINYMCLTAHFIDDDWQYHKRILNFRQVPNHKGETIGKLVESLLLSWGIDKIFTLTVDNAASTVGL